MLPPMWRTVADCSKGRVSLLMSLAFFLSVCFKVLLSVWCCGVVIHFVLWCYPIIKSYWLAKHTTTPCCCSEAAWRVETHLWLMWVKCLCGTLVPLWLKKMLLYWAAPHDFNWYSNFIIYGFISVLLKYVQAFVATNNYFDLSIHLLFQLLHI